MELKRFTAVFGKSGSWWSGDIAPSSTVTDDNGLFKSEHWAKVKSSRSKEQFLDNLRQQAGPDSIIIEVEIM